MLEASYEGGKKKERSYSDEGTKEETLERSREKKEAQESVGVKKNEGTERQGRGV